MNRKSQSLFKRKSLYQIGITFVLVLMTSLFQNCGRRYLPAELGDSDLNSKADIIGAQLYSENCFMCHGAIDSTTVDDKSEAGIHNALQTQNQMQFISITPEQVTYIAAALNPTDNTTAKLRNIGSVETSNESLEIQNNDMYLQATDQGH